MKRRGLWAACLVLLLLVGVVGVLAVGTGYATDEENAGAKKCSVATLHGTYPFAFDGVEITGNNDRPRSPLQGMQCLTATVRRKASLPLTLTGRFLVRSPSPARTPSRRIAPAPSPLRMVRRSICSSPLMAVCLRSCRPSPPSLWGRAFNRRGRPSGSESELLSSPIAGRVMTATCRHNGSGVA